MSFDKEARNALARMVTACRKRLIEDVTDQLRGIFGLHPDGTVLILDQLAYLSEEQKVDAQALRELLDHFVAGAAGMEEERRRTAYERLVLEISFTILNRLVALRLCEERGLVLECVRKGMASDGFRLFERLSGGALDTRYQTYRFFLESLFDELSVDLGMLFDRTIPQSAIFPSERCIEDVLAQLNDANMASLWAQDETIGWVYQYFNPPEERRAMREKSPAPRNSRELAVRNQFFTPRYVVEFLTDNTLGRTWYEMRRGETHLKEDCRYLVRRPNEIFLDPGQRPLTPESDDKDLSREELIKQPFYILHRENKDPRDIKVLDPACGSGHFLLYAYDLFETIYQEAWEDEYSPRFEATGKRLCEDYETRDAMLRALPDLILRYNLYGIDIDSRACQIAALALWLRAQRAYRALGLKPIDRLPIKKTNIVCAEPMPGEIDMLREFTAGLTPKVLVQFVEVVFEKMKLAGEAGSLLKIVEEIRETVEEAKAEYQKELKRRQDEDGYLPGMAPLREPTLFDDLTDDEFWTRAENDIADALEQYARQAEKGQSFQCRLFADDTAQGFAFVDVCRKRFDVVLMNPPFGDPPRSCQALFQTCFPLTAGDLYAMFYERTIELLSETGKVGAITNRTWLGLPTYEALRTKVFGSRGAVEVAADLGSFVLDDAQVETLAAIVGRDATNEVPATWIRLLKTKQKSEVLLTTIQQVREGERQSTVFISSGARFSGMPTSVYGYWMSDALLGLYQPKNSIEARAADVKQGTATADDFRFLRLAWEVPADRIGLDREWARFAKGGVYSPFFDDIHLVIRWEDNGKEIIAWGRGRPQNIQFFGRVGITWPLRTTSPFGPRALPAGCAFGHKGSAAIPRAGRDPLVLLGLLASRPARLLLSVRLGAGDDAPGSASKSYEVGLIRDLPFPALSDEQSQRISTLTLRCIRLMQDSVCDTDETAVAFFFPSVLADAKQVGLRETVAKAVAWREERLIGLSESSAELDELVASAFNFSESDRTVMAEELELPLNKLSNNAEVDTELFRQAYLTKYALPGERLPGGVEAEVDVRVESRRKRQQTLRDEETLCRLFEISPRRLAEIRRQLSILRQSDAQELCSGIVSYLLGTVYGRWDIRLVLDAALIPKQLSPFERLPRCLNGMLQSPSDLPASSGSIVSETWLRARHDAATLPAHSLIEATVSDSDYPVRISWDGLLVQAPPADGSYAHPEDIIRRIRELIVFLWDDRSEVIEQQICELLKVGSLREYFQKPSFFFDDHLRRHFKSRRVAPIYWPLSTASGSYTVWVYYHRLTDQTLYTIVNRYVEPKIAEMERAIGGIENDMATASGRQATQLRDWSQEACIFLGELQDMRQELLRVAGLPYKPDLNDGVIINAAPLHRLFRHRQWAKDTRDCWERLEREEYEWSHMAYTIWPKRVRDVCRRDRSIAIAHGLEALYEPASPSPGRRRRRQQG
jgi:hypothetical protein